MIIPAGTLAGMLLLSTDGENSRLALSADNLPASLALRCERVDYLFQISGVRCDLDIGEDRWAEAVQREPTVRSLAAREDPNRAEISVAARALGFWG